MFDCLSIPETIIIKEIAMEALKSIFEVLIKGIELRHIAFNAIRNANPLFYIPLILSGIIWLKTHNRIRPR